MSQVSCTIVVTFSPNTLGNEAATLGVSANPGGSPAAALSGAGVFETALDPNGWYFGAVTEGSKSVEVGFTLTNATSNVIDPLGLTITGSNADDFIVDATSCGSTLAGGASCALTVSFSPSTTGLETASIEVASSLAGEQAGLLGIGVQ
jgi:hypothetical protein